ncbi:hypothetical protein Avbf_07142 [Armadillidium vulgare]|nr:hypothetical protein Avbf_07142 [Armadillidium vulgare]
MLIKKHEFYNIWTSFIFKRMEPATVYAFALLMEKFSVSEVGMDSLELNSVMNLILTPAGGPRSLRFIQTYILGKLYVVGGSDGSHSLCSTEIYDPDIKINLIGLDWILPMTLLC